MGGAGHDTAVIYNKHSLVSLPPAAAAVAAAGISCDDV